MRIELDNLSRTAVQALIRTHLEHAADHTPKANIKALDLAGLKSPDVTLWTAWDEDTLLGCGALRQLDAKQGEIKSMHTYESHRGKGIGRQMVSHIIDVARERKYSRLSLETARFDAYAPARQLYHQFGFQECEPFGAYSADPCSIFMALEL